MKLQQFLDRLAYHVEHSKGLPHGRTCGLHHGWRCDCWQPDLSAVIKGEYESIEDLPTKDSQS